MNTKKIKFIEILSIIILLGSQHLLSGQSHDFTKEYRFLNSSTIIYNIHLFGDSLLITGEVSADSSGLAGIFVATMDTTGVIGNFTVFRDPNHLDDLLLTGINPVIIGDNRDILLAGVFLISDNLFMMTLNSSLQLQSFKEYESNYKAMYIDGLIELYDCYYAVGTVQTQSFDSDIFIQKNDSNGNLIWEKTFGQANRDEGGFAILSESNGLTIRVSKSYNPTQTIKNDTRYWTQFMHIDTSGFVKWMWEEEVTGDEGYGGAFVKYGSDYIYTTNFLGEEYSAGILQAAQLVRRDSAFNLVWRKVYGEPVSFSNYFGDMIISRDSNLLLTGQILDDSGDFNWARVMKICPNGEILCETRDTGYVMASGESLNRMEGIVESPTGSIYAVGYTNRSLFLFDGLILKVSPDGCIDTLCTTTDVEDLIWLEEQKIDAYPIPMQDELNIAVDDSTPPGASISIFNTLGYRVYTGHIEEHKKVLDVSNWAAGMYVIRFEANGTLIGSLKVIKLSN